MSSPVADVIAIASAKLPLAEVSPAIEPTVAEVDAAAADVVVRDNDPLYDRHMYVLMVTCLRVEGRLARAKTSTSGAA